MTKRTCGGAQYTPWCRGAEAHKGDDYWNRKHDCNTSLLCQPCPGCKDCSAPVAVALRGPWTPAALASLLANCEDDLAQFHAIVSQAHNTLVSEAAGAGLQLTGGWGMPGPNNVVVFWPDGTTVGTCTIGPDTPPDKYTDMWRRYDFRKA